MGAVMSTDRRLEKATPETWMNPPGGRWAYDQVKHLELPFDWELVDGVIVVRGMANWWHDEVRDELRDCFKSAVPDPDHGVNVERCVMLDDFIVTKPDVVIYDRRGLDLFTMDCTPAANVRLAVEVVSPGSAVDDRVRKPALYAAAGVPYFWRVERGADNCPEVHEYWLHSGTGDYVSAPEHPCHKGKLETDRPFPIGIDLMSVVGF
ncbi:Uma2 family endonuclease [Streptomyces sp. NPDC052496]|uniref:Uma2 family endonuclease n=1 Tax=Streptomyces sp. NPDC052496 TaxID=3154951 RepID=UPI00343DA6A3